MAKSGIGKQVLPYALLSPAVLVTLLIVFFPMVQAAWMSLHQYILFKPRDIHFIGLKNFAMALQDEVFWISLGHTLLWIGITVPAQLLLGLVTALLLNQRFFWRPLARALIIIPWALPSVVIALMWVWIYDSNYGILNDLLLRLDIVQSAIPWLADPDTALYAIILTLTWQGFPFFAVMILAALQAIPASYYEAAAIDGARFWKRFWTIVLPLLSPTAFFLLVVNVVYSFFETFGVIHMITSGGPQQSTTVLVYKVFSDGFVGQDLGSSAAQSVILLFVVGLLTIVQFKFVEKRVHY